MVVRSGLVIQHSISIFTTASASESSPYESGRDHGCDDAGISDPDDRYINQPEKGPSFHTDEFMRGYNDGYDECSEGGDSDGSGSSDEPDRDFGGDNDGQPSGGSINWENLCMNYGDLINISPDERDRYAQGTQLTDAGEDVLACNLITRVGPGSLRVGYSRHWYWKPYCETMLKDWGVT